MLSSCFTAHDHDEDELALTAALEKAVIFLTKAWQKTIFRGPLVMRRGFLHRLPSSY